MATAKKTSDTRSAAPKKAAVRPGVSGTRRNPAPSNRVELNPNNPIPFEIGNQTFVTMGGDTYIPFFAPNDQFAMTLLEARILSNTQSSCITTKNFYLVGQGIGVTNLKDHQTVDPTWTAMVTRANGRRQSLNRVFTRGFDSLQTFGNTPFELVRTTVAGKKFLNIYAHNFLECRLASPNDDTGEIEFVYVSRLFRKKGIVTITDKMKIKKIPIYKPGRASDADNWLQDGDVERSMIWVKTEMAGYDWYGLPQSVPSLIYQVLEYGHARYNLDNVDNNMVIGDAIFLTGSINQTEADRIGSAIVKRHTGPGKRGRVAVFASAAGIDDVHHVPYNTQKEGSYKDNDAICESKIIMSHQWDSILAGLKHQSSLGKGGGYLKEVYEQKLKSVIIPFATFMLEEVMPSLIDAVKIWLGADWSKYKFGFTPIQIDNKTSEVSTTVNGLLAFIDIITLVATGAYQLEAAVKLVMDRFGKSEQEAREQLGQITVIPGLNVRPKPGGTSGADNPGGSPEKN